MERAKMVNDFLALIAELWDVEQFNMWNPAAHSSLAYLIDRSFDDEDYNTKFERWLYLAQDKNAVEFTWVVSQAIVQACMKDERISQNDKEYLSALLECQRINYEDNCTAGYVQVKEEYVPEWFFGLFGGYIRLEELKRENTIIEYLQGECLMSSSKAKEVYEKFCEHFDILNEFYFCLKNKRLVTFYPITAKGVSAQQLVESYGLSLFGAYSFLIYLRESPEAALEDLRKGLPRK